MQSHISELLDTCKMFDEKFITLVAETQKKKDINLIKEANSLKHSSDEKFITLVAEAEKKKDMNLIKEANVLKRSSDEKVEDRRKLEETLSILLEKKKKLQAQFFESESCLYHCVFLFLGCYFLFIS